MSHPSKSSGIPPIGRVTILDTDLHDVAVVTEPHPAPGLANATEKFIDELERATGVRLPLGTAGTAPAGAQIVVGQGMPYPEAVKAALARVKHDGYVIVADSGQLYLTANTIRGKIYAMYGFLERFLGWKPLSATYRVVRPADEIRIPADLCLVDNPYFEYRDVLWYDNMADPNQKNALRLNGTYRCEMSAFGGGREYAAGWYPGGGFVHTLKDLAEMKDYKTGDQPCLTDEAVFRTVRKNVRRLLDQYPQAEVISVSQNDSYPGQGGCSCARCRAIDEREGTSMGSLLTFVNRIADDIRDDYPHVAVDTLAYRYTRKAPKTVRPADNVIVRLCSIECCFSHPIEDGECAANLAFGRDIEAWAAICHRLYIWDYTTDFLYYLSPFPDLGVLWDNVQFFRRNHAAGIFEQGNYQSVSGELAELRAYLLSHMLWDPDITKEQYFAMMDEFLADYYGAGWRYVRQYIDETSAAAARRHLHIYDDPAVLFPPEPGQEPGQGPGQDAVQVSEGWVRLWDQALAEAQTPAQKDHVETSRLAAEFNCLTVRTDAPVERKRILLEGIRAHGITSLHERTTLPAEVDVTSDPKRW